MEKIIEDIMGDHIGVRYSTELLVEKKENGEWFVTQIVTQRVSDDLEVWDERVTKFEAKGFKLERTIAEAAVLATLYLESINYDLFSIDIDLREGEYLQ